jgi:hypothetical protein
MHVLVAGYPRCRTSFLMSAYSNFYGLSNYHEKFDFYFDSFVERAKIIKKNPELQLLQNKQIEHLKKVSNTFFKEENAIIKLFPRHLVSYFGLEREFTDLNSFNYKIITNVSTTLQLSKYSEIIISDRNFIDSAISYIYGKHIGKMLFLHKHELDSYKIKNNNITIEPTLFPIINYFILEYLIFLDLKKFLNENYKCTIIDYDNCITTIDNKFNNLSKNMYNNPNFDYRSVITNYNELVSYISETYTNYLQIYDNHTFI